MTVTVHGWAFSPYVRAVRIALLEKGVAHALKTLTPPDLASAEGRRLSPFGKVPVLDHGDRRLVETTAILDYVEAAFPGPSLLSGDPWRDGLGRMISASAGAYLYPTAVMGVFFSEAYVEANGGRANPDRVAAAVEATRPPLSATAAMVGRLLEASGGPFLGGERLGLADAGLAPMLENLSLARAGQGLLADHPVLEGWLRRAVGHPSVRATQVPIPDFGLPPD